MNNITSKLNEAFDMVDFMIEKAEEQGITNILNLSLLKDVLHELYLLSTDNLHVSAFLMSKWNKIYGQIFRALEGTDLLRLLDEIDFSLNQLSSKKQIN